MKPPVIPAENPDLIALVKANDRRFLVKWLITTALMAVLAVVCFSPAANKYGIPVAILLGLGFVVLPFPLCGGIGWITDRGFAGTVWFKSFGFVQLFYSNRIETRRVSSSIIHYSLFILHSSFLGLSRSDKPKFDHPQHGLSGLAQTETLTKPPACAIMQPRNDYMAG